MIFYSDNLNHDHPLQAPGVIASPECSGYTWLITGLQALSLSHYR